MTVENKIPELDELDYNASVPPAKTKEIIHVNSEWPWWQRLLANLVNASGVFLWLFFTVVSIWHFNQNAELVILRNAMMNVIVSSVTYGIMTLVSAMTLVSWFFPYFSFRRLMQEGTPIERAACCGFWSAIAIAIAIIIASGLK
jgi:hypothetical protein